MGAPPSPPCNTRDLRPSEDKLVLGENISQTASFVVSGGTDVGMVALSLALCASMKEKGKYVEIPASDYPAIEQAVVVVRSSSQKRLARELLAFLKTPEIQVLMRKYGFAPPGGQAASQSSGPLRNYSEVGR